MSARSVTMLAVTAALMATGAVCAGAASASPPAPPTALIVAPPDSSGTAAADTLAPVLQPDRTAAYYFHATIRCHGCLWIEAHADSTIRTAFAQPLKEGRLEWHVLNFEEPQNQALAQEFRIEGSTLVIAQLVDGEVVRSEQVDQTWYLVGKPAEFFALVRGRVAAYLGEEKAKAVAK